MAAFSLCMIVKNEEQVLERCLSSVAGLFDEIIIVDTGSDDATKEIAARFTEGVYDFEWIDDFSAARNFAFSKASCDYIMWMDADDVLPQKSRDELLKLKNSLSPAVDTVMMKYDIAFDDNDNVTFSYYRERILRNCALAIWRGVVHEVITPFGKILYSDIAVEHRKEKQGDSGRNLRIYERQLERGAPFSLRDRFYYARELYYAGRMAKAAVELEQFLDEDGWIENSIEACRILAYCYYAVGENEEALRALLRSFKYDVPRAETCCDIGKHFFDRNLFKQALFWYELALNCKRDDSSCAFVQPDCYGFIPALQASVCCWRLGDIERAIDYNERAEAFKPGDPICAANREFYAER